MVILPGIWQRSPRQSEKGDLRHPLVYQGKPYLVHKTRDEYLEQGIGVVREEGEEQA